MVGYAVIAHDAAITFSTETKLKNQFDTRHVRDLELMEYIGDYRSARIAFIERMASVCGVAERKVCHIACEANLTGGENVGGTTAAPATPEAGSDDDDGGGDPDPEPERQTRTRKPRNTSPAGNLPAPSAAQSADALNQFDTRPAASFVRLPVVCSLYACSPATAWRWVKARKIPAPVKLSDRVTAWRVGDLRAALAQLAA